LTTPLIFRDSAALLFFGSSASVSAEPAFGRLRVDLHRRSAVRSSLTNGTGKKND
jgi:hypothetical protein